MKKFLTFLIAGALVLSGISAYAAGYEVISEINIGYSCVEESYVDDAYEEYWDTRTYSNLISNFSNRYSV